MKTGNLEVDELRRAESEIIRYVQFTSFPELIRTFGNPEPESGRKLVKKTLPKAGASACKLNPRMNDGLLVVGGRLQNARVDEGAKHPMILPYKHHVTVLIIKHHHAAVGHMGQESVLASLREKF